MGSPAVFTGVEYEFVLLSVIAGLIASVACGLGALPLWIGNFNYKDRIGQGYSFAAGLMFAASVYNLLLPAFTLGFEESLSVWPVTQTLIGVLGGCWFLWWVERELSTERVSQKTLSILGGRTQALVFIAMACHSIPEGVAVGVGFASETHIESLESLGVYIAIAISIHNIPEGLAVALPIRSQGSSVWRGFFMAFLTSLPQPLAAIPASILVWLFEPLMLPLFGFAAGAMMFLVLVELIPDSLESQSRSTVAWSFMLGFSLMVLVQVVI